MVKKFNSEQYMNDVEITRSNIEEELCKNPANLAYYIEQYALWGTQVDLAKQQRDTRAAQIYLEIKDSGVKSTEGSISATQQLDEQHQEFCKKLTLAREQQALYQGAVTALEKKQFSLGSLNSNNRLEQDMGNSHTPTRLTADSRREILDKITTK